jgi:transposase
MKEELIARLSRRYLALDIHKHYSVVAGVNFEGQVVVEPVRIEHAELESWLEKHIQPTDYVVIESTTNAWHIYDMLEPLAEKVLVAANMIPTIWVPPVHVRNLRYLLSQRRHLVGMHTQTVNRMHSVAHRHHLSHPRGKRFNEKNTQWQQDEELSDSEKFQLELDMNTKQHLAEQAEKITKKLARMSHQKPWAESMLYLMQLPGFGVITGMTVLAAIGDISRFEDFKKLSSYSGLTPGVEQSGVKKRGKRITKEGRKDLRWALVEVAQRAVKSDPVWKCRFHELCRRMHKNQAIVVIAHRLLELVWYVLSRRQPYRHFSHERIAYKYLTWSWQLSETDRDGLTRQQFVRYYLTLAPPARAGVRLGIGHDLKRIALNPKHPRRLASEAELLALRPELNQTE